MLPHCSVGMKKNTSELNGSALRARQSIHNHNHLHLLRGVRHTGTIACLATNRLARDSQLRTTTPSSHRAHILQLPESLMLSSAISLPILRARHTERTIRERKEGARSPLLTNSNLFCLVCLPVHIVRLRRYCDSVSSGSFRTSLSSCKVTSNLAALLEHEASRDRNQRLFRSLRKLLDSLKNSRSSSNFNTSCPLAFGFDDF